MAKLDLLSRAIPNNTVRDGCSDIPENPMALRLQAVAKYHAGCLESRGAKGSGLKEEVSGKNWEYVADDLPPDQPVPVRDLDDPGLATAQLIGYMRSRVLAVMNSLEGDPALMLSGGVDSIITLAALVDSGRKPVCVTVVGRAEAETDLDRALQAAKFFGVAHEVINLEGDSLRALIVETVRKLGLDELWEVTAAIPFKAAFDRLDSIGMVEGPVFTGGGADVLLAGGTTLVDDPKSEAVRRELERELWDSLHTRFIYKRQIPDFYERILGSDSERLFQFFQTRAAWEATCRFSPAVLFSTRNGSSFDKFALRQAAEDMGVPPSLAWTSKEPLQVSSGIIGAAELLSRQMVSGFPGASTYSDPLTEPSSQVLARWAIREATRD